MVDDYRELSRLIECVVFQDGLALATTSADETTKLWSVSNECKHLNTYTAAGNKWVWDCAFTNDSKYMINAASGIKFTIYHIPIYYIV